MVVIKSFHTGEWCAYSSLHGAYTPSLDHVILKKLLIWYWLVSKGCNFSCSLVKMWVKLLPEESEIL
jgi:hypothetical protein